MGNRELSFAICWITGIFLRRAFLIEWNEISLWFLIFTPMMTEETFWCLLTIYNSSFEICPFIPFAQLLTGLVGVRKFSFLSFQYILDNNSCQMYIISLNFSIIMKTVSSFICLLFYKVLFKYYDIPFVSCCDYFLSYLSPVQKVFTCAYISCASLISPCISFRSRSNNFQLIIVQDERYRHMSLFCTWIPDFFNTEDVEDVFLWWLFLGSLSKVLWM